MDEIEKLVLDELQNVLGFVNFDMSTESREKTEEQPDPCYGEFGYGKGDVIRYTETDVLLNGFSFIVDGVKVSGRFKKPAYGGTCHITDDSTELDGTVNGVGVAKAIYDVCGPINYGDDCHVGVIVGGR